MLKVFCFLGAFLGALIGSYIGQQIPFTQSSSDNPCLESDSLESISFDDDESSKQNEGIIYKE